jgi:hypothetical protein
MDNNFLHTFELAVEGITERLEFSMYYETADVKEVIDAFSAYVARQEDNFLPLGLDAAVRATRIYFIRHLRVGTAPLEN